MYLISMDSFSLTISEEDRLIPVGVDVPDVGADALGVLTLELYAEEDTLSSLFDKNLRTGSSFVDLGSEGTSTDNA